MEILGYSERGILNSLLYEIRYAKNGDELLNQLIDKMKFPLTDDKPLRGNALVLVEQSLSDFGDADAVVLIQSDANKKCAIFIEAKVGAKWSIEDRFDGFKKGVKSDFVQRGFSSNIFTQLYHKQQIIKYSMDELKAGICFPKWSFTKKAQAKGKKRKIGCNPVVRKAAEEIKQYCDEAFYLLLVPEDDSSVDKFFNDTLRKISLPEVPGWDASHFGYLTWGTVEKFCEQCKLNDTLDTFEYNGEQIYKK